MTLSKSRRLISLSFLILGPWVGVAATPEVLGPDEYFHRGATNYIFGKMQQAKEVVEAGLRQYTNDFKLQKLYEKLKQQQQQNQQQSKDDKKDESKKDQQSKNDQQDQSKPEQKEQEKQDQQQQQNQKPESQSPDQNQTEKKENQSQPEDRNGQDEKPDEQKQAAKARLGQMTPQEAQRLLDTVRSDERTLIFTPRVKTNRTDRVFKDW